MAKKRKSPDKIVASPRIQVYSWFVTFLGGYNATPGYHCGRYELPPDDETAAMEILEQAKKDARRPLEEELIKLKAKLYDLQEKGKGV